MRTVSGGPTCILSWSRCQSTAPLAAMQALSRYLKAVSWRYGTTQPANRCRVSVRPAELLASHIRMPWPLK